ncbi:MAG: DinB family protein [Flavobacteriia bacterium]|nr:DinB family protein [Flavobacteriia bacterium]
MYTKELLEEIKKITLADLDLVKKKLIYLSKEQLTWKPNENSWSIQEVLAHLNEYSKFYNAAFIEKIEKTKFRKPLEVFISSPLGRSAWKSMKLGNAKNVKRKFKSMRSYNPSFEAGLIKGNEVEQIQRDFETFLAIIEKAEAVSLRRVKIPISISKIIRLRLGDALLFVAYHNERHFQQIVNVLAQKQFPSKK